MRLLELPDHLREQLAAGAITVQQRRDLPRSDTAGEWDLLANRFLADRAARGGAARRERTPLDDQLAGVAGVLTGLLDTRVRIRAKGDATEITIVVRPDECSHVLEKLGVAA